MRAEKWLNSREQLYIPGKTSFADRDGFSERSRVAGDAHNNNGQRKNLVVTVGLLTADALAGDPCADG